MSGASGEMKPQPRCFLFVPADDQRKLAKVLGCGADAVIIDLEDSVAPDKKAAARKMAKQFLSAHIWNKRRPRLYVRINDLATGLAQDDLAAVIPETPDGVMLPKANSGSDVAVAGSIIDSLAGGNTADIGIVAIATETPLALLQMHSFVGPHPRLEGLTWGSEDLGTALGVTTARDASGRLTGPFALARNLCLVAAHAAGVQPIDTIYADFQDEPGLMSEAAEAARDGFTGKMAIHPAQVPVINEAFAPSADEIERARRVVAAFDAHPGAGTVGLDGKMLDRPHCIRARRVLELAERLECAK